MNICYWAETHIGNVRSRNEDTYVLKEVWNGSHLLAVVIDGMGGHAGGDVAARLAAGCIEEHIDSCDAGSGNHLEMLHAAVVYANNSINAQHSNPFLYNMGCVLTAVLIDLESCHMDVCHVGDTRLYALSNGVFTKITRDHSVVGPMEESGQITELQAIRHPQRNRITRSVGMELLEMGSNYIQTHSLKLEPCTLLLCSDGLYDMVHSTEIIPILSAPDSTEHRVQGLIDAALKAGGRDNVTVIVIDIWNVL